MTVQIRLLSRNKKIIPIRFTRGAFQTTNARLPTLVLGNGYDHPVTLDRVEIRGSGGGIELVVYRIPAARLSGAIRDTTRTLQTRTRIGRDRIGVLHGELTVDPADLALDPLPGRSVALPLGDVVFLDYTGFEPVERMDIEVFYGRAGGTESARLSLPMTDFRCRGDYHFPLQQRDRLYHTTNPVANLTGHRGCRAEEFAIDMVAARQDAQGRLVTRSPGPSAHARDYFVFGEEVRAIGAGVVTRVCNLFPDGLLDNLDGEYPKRKQRVVAELSETIGRLAAYNGNHLVIDHGNGEFSQYCHLIGDSIPVQAGDRVIRGQGIGRVGNTGNSTVPHLHLQLMDGPDETSANGLPIVFQDIDAEQINDEVGEHCNTLMFSPCLYFTL